MPNSTGERRSFFHRLEPFLDDLKQIVQVRDWNAILNPQIDKGERGAYGLDRYESSLIDLVDRYRLDHTGREIWIWIDSSPSV